MIGDATPELHDIAETLDRISGQIQEVEIGNVTGEARLPARDGGPQARQAAEFVRAYIGVM